MVQGSPGVCAIAHQPGRQIISHGSFPHYSPVLRHGPEEKWGWLQTKITNTVCSMYHAATEVGNCIL